MMTTDQIKDRKARDLIKELESIDSTGPRIGWACTYTPEEVIVSAGAVPFRILNKQPISDDKGYLPINFCPFIKSIMQQVFKDAKLDAVIITNSCDGLRRLYDVIDYYKEDMHVFLLDVPRNTGDISIDHFSKNLEEMGSFLSGITSKNIDGQSLYRSIKLVSEKKRTLKKLQKIYLEDPETLSFSEYAKVIEISSKKDPNSFAKTLKNMIDSLSGPKTSKTDSKKYTDIFLSGSFIFEKKLWELFDELDIRIVEDDICSTSRYFSNIIEAEEGQSSKELYRSLAGGYLKKVPCMRMADLGHKLSLTMDNLIKSKAKGLLYTSMKFCDNSILFYPLLKEKLKDEGIPSLFLELENNNFPQGQIKTRLQAFKELII